MDSIAPTSTTSPKRRRNVSQLSAASTTTFDDAASRAPSSHCGSDYEDDDVYRAKRSRNNAAVRKSRERSKAKAGQAEHELRRLRQENLLLDKRESQLKEELELLKETFMKHMMEHLDRSRAYDALSDDNNNENNNNNNDVLFLSGEQLCHFGGVDKGFTGTVSALIPATTAAAIQKDDAAGNVASVVVNSIGRGVIDLKKEKELRKNIVKNPFA